MRVITALFLMGGLLFPGCSESGMAKLCVFSEVSGVLLDQGRPVVDAQVERSWAWDEGDFTADEVRTDREGRFRLPALYKRSFLLSILPGQVVIRQRIVFRIEGKEHLGYDHVKTNLREGGEFERSPFGLECRLEADPEAGDVFWGICALSDPSGTRTP